MLKAILTTLEGVPADIAKEYALNDKGQYVLQAEVEEHPAVHGLKTALTNVRTEKASLKTELDKFVGVDLAKYATMTEHERMIQEGKLVAEGKIEELLALRTTALRDSMAKDLNSAKAENQNLQLTLNRLVIDNAVQAAAVKQNVKSAATGDVLLRARDVFRVVEGKAVVHDNGQPVYSKNGTDYLGIEEWVENLSKTAPHLFEESTGVQATGGKPKQGVPGPGTIMRNDQAGILQNLDKIAKGQVKVIM